MTARFVLGAVPCEHPADANQCYTISLVMTGGLNETRLVAPAFVSQSGCSAHETVVCAGASGTSAIATSCDADGACVVQVKSESDGYCPTNDCARVVVRDQFSLPHGAHLVMAPTR